MKQDLHTLIERLKDIADLSAAQSLLMWDQETKLPKKAINSRVRTMGTLAGIIHQHQTDKGFEEHLAKLVDLKTGDVTANGLSEAEYVMVTDVYKDWKRATCLPESFQKKYQEAISKGQHIWAEARANNAFSDFEEALSTIVDLSIEQSSRLAEGIGKNAAFQTSYKQPYDWLLDAYEPGSTVAQLDPLFNDLRAELKHILEAINNDPSQTWKQGNVCLAGKTFDVSKQWEFGLEILADMGFDFDKGYQEKSAHPFTINFHPSDVRITTRLKETDIFEALSSTIHEGGHALYEQGLNSDWYGTPLAEATSLGVHESQSRFWENRIGKSQSFWKRYYPVLVTYFPDQLHDVSEQAFYEASNQVTPGEIRVEADEVTYDFHIMIRYDIEKKLINREVTVRELPELWNAMYQEYLGVTPATDANGVLQDVHWSSGGIGYFPTYTLGNIMASQIYEAMEKTIAMSETVTSGDLKTITSWLNTHIHQHGRQFSSNELMERISGGPMSTAPYISYLKKKYGV